jgi:peroxiredoxin
MVADSNGALSASMGMLVDKSAAGLSHCPCYNIYIYIYI